MKLPVLLDPAMLGEAPVLVAVSGGMDSMVLLHQVRFAVQGRRSLTVAHLDHAMRPGSGRDATWLAGVCAAWRVPLLVRRLSEVPESEEQARDRRLQFLEEAREACGAAVILTAHHADDQAETVFFRILRGTGHRGLQGITAVRGPYRRPLLGVWRDEIERYAEAHGVPWRTDPTNRDLSIARNVIRHRLLPDAEARVAPGSRRALVRLAENVTRHQEEILALESEVFHGAIREVARGRVEVAVSQLADLPTVLRPRLLRRAGERVGIRLSHAGTRKAEEALGTLQVGRGLDLTGGLRLVRGRDHWIFLGPESGWHPRATKVAGGADGADGVCLPGPGSGARILKLGPATFRVAWGTEPLALSPQVGLQAGLRYPLTVRAWTPGDRIRLSVGSKTVARLLSEVGVPAVDRRYAPVVVDDGGETLWVPGVARSVSLHEGSDRWPGGERLFVACTRVTG